MGFDVSYHPVSEQQLHDWYFASLDSDSHARDLCARHQLEPLYTEKFLELLGQFRAAKPGPDASFDRTHGYFAAITQGFFGRYHYLRGCMLSGFSGIEQFTRPWSEIAPGRTDGYTVHNQMFGNYCSGVYVPAEQIAPLTSALRSDPTMVEAMTQAFPGEHAAILFAALDEAASGSLGLLEATEVIEPNPMDLEATTSPSKLFNCDTAGALLYAETAKNQLAALGIPAGTEIVRVTSEVLAQEGGLDAALAASPSTARGLRSRLRRRRG